jgi:hypothetical protein
MVDGRQSSVVGLPAAGAVPVPQLTRLPTDDRRPTTDDP